MFDSIACPHCNEAFPWSDEYAGKTMLCPTCDREFRVEVPAPDLPTTNVPSEFRDQDFYPQNSPSKFQFDRSAPNTLAIVMGAFMGAIVLGCSGLLSSQYVPVFGGFLERTLAEPFSPARLSIIPVHLFVFVPLGALCGGILAWLLSVNR
ncbi:MAG TPA: hypothetical protein VGG64_19205 [Pirellulales bacterium]